MRKLLAKIRKILRDRRTRRFLTRFVSGIAAIVVFVTTYALVLPAITMEKEANCGIEAHQHDDSCYTGELICDIPESGGHHHDESCYSITSTLICGMDEHEHSVETGCYDEDGNLICEKKEHRHNDECYEETRELTCQIPESEGHQHTDACYEKVLTCGKEIHIHSTACYEYDFVSDSAVAASTSSASAAATSAGSVSSAGMTLSFVDETVRTAGTDEQAAMDQPVDNDRAIDNNGFIDNGGLGETDGSSEIGGLSETDRSSETASSGEGNTEVPMEMTYGSENAGTGSTEASNAALTNADNSATALTSSTAADQYIPPLEAVDFNTVLNDCTGIYYHHVADGETVEDSHAIPAEDWNRIPNNTDNTDLMENMDDVELGGNDLLRVYLSYTIPAGSLNATNPVARYRLPSNLHLTDSQVKAINENVNGIAGQYVDLSTLEITDPDMYNAYLGVEAVEGTRRPDETVEDYLEEQARKAGTDPDDAAEYISAVARVENVYDADGIYREKDAYLGQDLIFTFAPYSIEKNQHEYDSKGQPTKAGQEIKGWLTLDLNLGQVDFGEAEITTSTVDESEADNAAEESEEDTENPRNNTVTIERSERTAEIVFVEEGWNQKDNKIDQISTRVTVVEKTVIQTQDNEAEENSEQPAAENTEESGEGSTEESAAGNDADYSDKGDTDQVIMPAMSFTDSIRVSTGKPAGIDEDAEGTLGSAVRSLPQEAEVSVRVEADEGTFPAGTRMVLKAVEDLDAVAEAVTETVENGDSSVSADGVDHQSEQTKESRKSDTEEKKNLKTYGFQAVDITFLDKNGKEIQPAKPVRVAMTSEIAEQVKEEAKTGAVPDPVVVHVDDDGNAEQMELIAPEEIKPAQGKTEEELLEEDRASNGEQEETGTTDAAGEAPSVGFTADSFSVYAIVYTVDFHYEANGNSLRVTVVLTDENDIARISDVRIDELNSDSKKYQAAYRAVVEFQNARGAEFAEENLGFFAADIALLDRNGEEIEPEGNVSVTIEILDLPADNRTLLSSLEVQHLIETTEELTVETVATSDDVRNTDDVVTAQFQVDSFSTFTLTWHDDGSSTVVSGADASAVLNIQKNGTTYARANVHYVDSQGNNITRPVSAEVSRETPVSIDGILNLDINGYQYVSANYGSRDGEEIASVAVERNSQSTSGIVYELLGNASNGSITGINAQPTGYSGFFKDQQGTQSLDWIIMWNKSGFGNRNGFSGVSWYTGPVYGEKNGTITNYTYTLSFDNEDITPLTTTNTSGIWDNAADIYLTYNRQGDILRPATIHYGVLDANGFTEVEDEFTLDAGASSLSLDAPIPGHQFVAAYYATEQTETPASGNTQISPLLLHTGEEWQYQDIDTNDNGVVAEGSHIYVSYVEGSPHYTPTPDNGEVPAPTTIKEVTPNGNGTYNIQLDIIGENIANENKAANVLLIVDRTSSMSASMGTGNRLDAAKSAVHTLVDTLDRSDAPINMAVFSFDRHANAPYSSGGSYWTTDGSAITGYTDILTLAPSGSTQNAGGTNWEAALVQAKTVMETADPHPTYVVFLTDGNPTVDESTVNDWPWQQSNPNESHSVYTRARAVALTFDPKYKFYGVLCADYNSNRLLDALVTSMNNNHQDATHILANDATTLTNTFKDIADYIVTRMGTSDVSTNDGITSLSSVNAAVVGAAGAFKYYRAYKVYERTGDNGTEFYYINSAGEEVSVTGDQIRTYTYEDVDGSQLTYLYTQREEWLDAPGASYSHDSGVTWNLGAEGFLHDGVIYSIDFTIWPSQAAYDLLADLNNGIKVYQPGHDNSITDAERAQVYESNGIYYMKTNTTLGTSYSYGGDEYGDEIPYHQGAMNLDAQTISIEKLWAENYLDEYGPGASATGVKDSILLTVTKDGARYMDVEVKKNNENRWKRENLYISCGLITEDPVTHENVDLKEPGHDYSIIEPEEFSYYWDLISDVYRPMVINAVPTVLKLVEGESTNQEPGTRISRYESEGNVYYVIDGKTYQVVGTVTSAAMESTNYRRSHLNLTKEVIGGSNDDDYFTYQIQIDEASNEEFVWFSILDDAGPDANTGDDYNYSEHLVKEDGLVTGAEKEMRDGAFTGYYFFPNDGETTITVKIKEGWNVRFINLNHDSTFNIKETEMGEEYEYVGINGEAHYRPVEATGEWYEINGEEQEIEGTIDYPNSSYVVTFTNRSLSAPVAVLKVDENEDSLAGARFKLMQGSAIVDADGLESGQFTSETEKTVLNLGSGIYCLTEMESPAGYVILNNKVYFKVTLHRADIEEEEPQAPEDEGNEGSDQSSQGLIADVVLCDEEGNPTEYDNAWIDDGDNIVTVVVQNTPGAALPNTGGSGTSIFTILGSILILGAGVLLWRRRRLI